MSQLKPLYDAVMAAENKVKAVMQQMLDAFNSGTEEGKTQALDLRAELDAAKLEAEQANQVYVSARDAGDSMESVNAAARKFVPVNEKTGKSQSKELKRADFEALSPADKMDYVMNGGLIVE
jgi:hypothetical protein